MYELEIHIGERGGRPAHHDSFKAPIEPFRVGDVFEWQKYATEPVARFRVKEVIRFLRIRSQITVLVVDPVSESASPVPE